MLAGLETHLWQSTLFAAAIAVVAWLLRHARADVRHRLWLAASVKFLVPFAALEAIGHRFAPIAPAAAARFDLSIVIETLGQPLAPPVVVPAPHAATEMWMPTLSLVAAAIWCVGSLAVAAVWLARWRRVAAVVRNARPIDSGREWAALRRLGSAHGVASRIPIVESDTSAEPGIFGIAKPVLLWPRRISEHLRDEQIDTILAHEITHVRRRDNLVAVVHMLVEAAFWFHPVVWWIGVRLTDERERACDETVLRSGHEPEIYAETILTSCRVCLESPLPCVAGVTGSDLKKRIERIMHGDTTRTLTAWHKTAIAALAGAAVAAPIAIGATSAAHRSSALHGLSLQTLEPPPTFDVASVKPNPSSFGKAGIQIQPGGRFDATNVTLRQLIRNAYQLQESQIVGGPGWLSSDRFDVVAKAEGVSLGDLFQPEKIGGPSRGQLMLRALLADRFKLAVHTESKEQPIYALVLARGDGALGPKIQRSTRDCDPSKAERLASGAPTPRDEALCGMRVMPGTIEAGGVTLRQLAALLSPLVGRIVQDRTGRADDFEFTLRYTPDQIPQGFDKKASAIGLPPIDPDGPSIFTALHEQLGLKLDSQKASVDILVVDRAERPVAN